MYAAVPAAFTDARVRTVPGRTADGRRGCGDQAHRGPGLAPGHGDRRGGGAVRAVERPRGARLPGTTGDQDAALALAAHHAAEPHVEGGGGLGRRGGGVRPDRADALAPQVLGHRDPHQATLRHVGLVGRDRSSTAVRRSWRVRRLRGDAAGRDQQAGEEGQDAEPGEVSTHARHPPHLTASQPSRSWRDGRLTQVRRSGQVEARVERVLVEHLGGGVLDLLRDALGRACTTPSTAHRPSWCRPPCSAAPARSGSATLSNSSGPKPRVVSAGVPRRTPEVYQAPFGSDGTELRLVTTPASSSADSAWRPVRPNDGTSSSTRWLSVPSVTSFAPRFMNPSASDWALSATCCA